MKRVDESQGGPSKMNDYERQNDGGDRVPDHRVKWRMVLSWQTAKPLQCIKPNQK